MSVAPTSWRARCSAVRPQGPGPRLVPSTLHPCRRRVVPEARRRGESGGQQQPGQRSSGRRNEDAGGGFQFSNRRGMYRIQYNEYETEVRQDEAWKLLVPVVGGLVLAAAVIGPLVIGVAFTAVAIGAALSAGALFTSLFLPFFLFVGMGALAFGGMTFATFATLGTALLLPKLLTLAVVAGGLGLGALATSLFLKPASDKARAASNKADSERRGPAGRTIDVVPEPEPEVETDPEVDRQLREFDELLAGREEQRRRAERFKAGGGGGR